MMPWDGRDGVRQSGSGARGCVRKGGEGCCIVAKKCRRWRCLSALVRDRFLLLVLSFSVSCSSFLATHVFAFDDSIHHSSLG